MGMATQTNTKKIPPELKNNNHWNNNKYDANKELESNQRNTKKQIKKDIS